LVFHDAQLFCFQVIDFLYTDKNKRACRQGNDFHLQPDSLATEPDNLLAGNLMQEFMELTERIPWGYEKHG
jgi:hypothetical protein